MWSELLANLLNKQYQNLRFFVGRFRRFPLNYRKTGSSITLFMLLPTGAESILVMLVPRVSARTVNPPAVLALTNELDRVRRVRPVS